MRQNLYNFSCGILPNPMPHIAVHWLAYSMTWMQTQDCADKNLISGSLSVPQQLRLRTKMKYFIFLHIFLSSSLLIVPTPHTIFVIFDFLLFRYMQVLLKLANYSLQYLETTSFLLCFSHLFLALFSSFNSHRWNMKKNQFKRSALNKRSYLFSAMSQNQP